MSPQSAFLLISHAFDRARDAGGHRLATTPIIRFRQFHWWREAQSLLLIIPTKPFHEPANNFMSPMSSNRLLILDSDPICGDTIAAAAVAGGYETANASGVGQFLQYLQLWRPAFVLLDVMAQGDNGMAMLRHLWETHSPALVVLMGPVADQGRLHILQHLGAGHGLTMAGMMFKPLHRSELTQTLSGLRDSRHWLFFVSLTRGHEHLHSFPTRRSSASTPGSH